MHDRRAGLQSAVGEVDVATRRVMAGRLDEIVTES
jgi:hypothetical protein